ncbi:MULTISPECIES: TIGR04211 family SH3 domain-containing protein [unclassified Brenneria]|uniref:TIGR04211 family SH3 domain-containing protein n=1 Tax=unclassified Brenneria TaxID=2634434 RepID=UPI001554247A|nr:MULTISPECIES: TIGR04211 family SH3 domain-containing protein [unclassified Brenneria]MBJ7223668.1 SH3 domain-containing protein [Brenneria sp. L3-3C-1]MEE3644910.1 TIGR04211 family SH3 domain-containing protein [Brenneria sp. L3_3C_1]MEE3652340.1 TIGR04211 family SH3 domain-containing protein [Brenneria sp. HEZEL_4_2_4]NPD02297.1 SH3 domain-containing protein [Brenneria sp. hezel4-2-4]
MQKLCLIFFTLMTFILSATVHAEEKRYVSDELLTYIHSGPGNQYRIVGTLNAGDQVTVLSINQGAGYAQIRDDKNRTSWIPLDQLSETPSLRTRVPELESQVSDLTAKLNNIDQTWNQRTADMQQKVAASDEIINGLRNENQELKNQLIVAQKKVSAANVQLDDKQRTIILQWFMYGGGVAGVGLLLGLLLPHLIPRRKKNDRWMG